MSPLFLKFFKNEIQCSHCSSRKKDGYSVCPKHLRLAKTRWRYWSQNRREEGKCCYCDLKSYNGWLRCRKHTSYNRKKCLEWGAKNKDKLHQTWINRITTYTDQGKCPFCKQHRKLTGGFRRCWTCRKRHALHLKGVKVPVTATQKDLLSFCKKNRVSCGNGNKNSKN